MALHATAMVSDDSKVHSSAEIGANVIIERNVEIGPEVRIMANSFICANTRIGEGTTIHPGCVIGNVPQVRSWKDEESFTVIGRNNTIREYVTIHRGSEKGSSTVIGDDNFLMVQCHLGHDCRIENNVIVANGALLAGHVEVESGAFISGNVVFHQFCRVGRLAMIGGFTGINKDVPPFTIVRGPSATRGVNLVGLKRAGFKREQLKEIRKVYNVYYNSGLSHDQALERIDHEFASEQAAHFTDFIRSSKRGVCRVRYNKETYF